MLASGDCRAGRHLHSAHREFAGERTLQSAFSTAGRTGAAPAGPASGAAVPQNAAVQPQLPPRHEQQQQQQQQTHDQHAALQQQHAQPPRPPPSAAHTRQQSQQLPLSALGSVAGEPPPSVRWQGSLLDAYLGALHLGEGSPPEAGDALSYQRALWGGEAGGSKGGQQGKEVWAAEQLGPCQGRAGASGMDRSRHYAGQATEQAALLSTAGGTLGQAARRARV